MLASANRPGVNCTFCIELRQQMYQWMLQKLHGERNNVVWKRYFLKLGSVPPLHVLLGSWAGHNGASSWMSAGVRPPIEKSTPQLLVKYSVCGVIGAPEQSRYMSRKML